MLEVKQGMRTCLTERSGDGEAIPPSPPSAKQMLEVKQGMRTCLTERSGDGEAIPPSPPFAKLFVDGASQHRDNLNIRGWAI